MIFVSSAGRRNLRRSLLVSTALSTALVASAGAAVAANLTVSTATTSPVSTSVGDGTGAGDIIITTGGSVKLAPATASPAVTLDSGTESISNAGSILTGQGTEVQNDGQYGIWVSTDTTGGVTNSGTIKTGITQTTDAAGAIVTTGVGGDSAVAIEANLGKGFNNTGTISSIASSIRPTAVLIRARATAITFGVIDAGTPALNYGVHNSGSIYGIGYVNGTPTVALGFDGSDNPVSIPGLNNDTGGVIQATSADDNATAIKVGANTSLTGPGIVNSGTITATIASPHNAGVAKGIYIDTGATVTEIKNSGTIQATSSGAAGGDSFAIDVNGTGSLTTITNNASSSIFATAANAGDDATAIRDQSGTLTTITNAGAISASTTATGTAVAIDLTAGAGTTDIVNTGNIVGQINWGTGVYQLNSTAGIIISDLSVAAGGLSTVNLTGTSVMTGSSTLAAGGTLNLNVGSGATLNANATDFNASNVVFNSGSTYAISYNTATATQSGHIVADTATLHDGAIVNVTLTSYLGAATPTLTVVETNTALNFDTPFDPSNLVIGGIGAGYNALLATANANADLVVTLSRKTATQLGLTGNAATIYDASVDGLQADTTFGAAVGNISTVAGVVGLYNSLLPDLSSAREQTAIRTQDVTTGFVNDRLNLMRTVDQGAGDGGGQYNDRHRRAGMWLQESVAAEKGDGDIDTKPYDGTLYVLALGYDARDSDGDVWGGSVSYATMQYDAGLNSKDNSAKSTSIQIYHSLNRGIFFWDAMGSAGWNSYTSNRSATAGALTRSATADWHGYQGGLSSQIGIAGTLGPITFRPSAGLSYTYLSQGGYDETGGGAAMNLKVDSSSFSSLRGNAELRISGLFFKEPQIVPYLRGGVSQELMDTKPETSGSFASSGTAFKLKGTELDKTTPFAGAGISFVGGYSRLSFEYTGQLGSKFTSHQAVATASIMF